MALHLICRVEVNSVYMYRVSVYIEQTKMKLSNSIFLSREVLTLSFTHTHTQRERERERERERVRRKKID